MSGAAARHGTHADVAVSVRGAELAGLLAVPPHARGIVVFAHGSGSGRFSPRNLAVATALEHAGLATLLLDLLTPEEEAEDVRTRRLRFDVRLLGEGVVGAIDSIAADAFVGDLPPSLSSLPVGCFGASTGAAAALIAAAVRSERVRAVVSRGGRPDLAGDALQRVSAPTLLIVGGRDTQVVELNRMAQRLLAGPSRVELVPGAGHLFEEPGALERVAELAIDWFLEHLARTR
ncbi:MAG TPA: dienelactone hydrolase family protein [Thermoleophilaceae bacterium]